MKEQNFIFRYLKMLIRVKPKTKSNENPFEKSFIEKRRTNFEYIFEK